MLKEKIYFIVGIGTDIGKTFLVENLCRNFPSAMAIKPIVSGFKDDDENSDSIKLLNSTKQILKQVQDDDEGKIYQKICHPELVSGSILNSISPWRFTEAEDEGKIYQKICHPELVSGSILNSISPWRSTEAEDEGKVYQKICYPELVSGSILNSISPWRSTEAEDEGKVYQKICHPELVSGSILNSISPWRFTEAVSPHFAAKNSGTNINFLDVKNFCQEKIALAKTNNQFLFIEAAGGVMTPINDEKTFLDLAADLKIPTLLVSANYLGSISHTLCAVTALKSRNVVIEKIIINEDLPTQLPRSLSPNQTIENFSKIAVISLKNLLANKASPK
jgi:dethiobiotin synthase